MKIILPKTFYEKKDDLPVFFLAGPVRGGDDWQQACCREIQKYISDFYIAIPYYHKELSEDHPFIALRVMGDENYFERQLNWERYYLDLASTNGCVIFWLPVESTINPRIGGGPYATDTRGELGEWRGRLMNNPKLKVVVGGDADFISMSQIERNFKLAVRPDFPIYATLAETVKAAVVLAQE